MKITSTKWRYYTTKRLKEILDSDYGMNEGHTKDYGAYLEEIRSVYNKRMTKQNDKAAKQAIRKLELSHKEMYEQALELIEMQKVEIEMLKRELDFAHAHFLPPIIDNTPF